VSTVTDALRGRTSIRAFLPKPVPIELIKDILSAARRLGPGTLDPLWRIMVVSGPERDAVVELAQRLTSAPGFADQAGSYPIYPPSLWEPYRSRRFAIGEALYATIGIGREDKSRRLEQFARNFELFGAPVGIFFVIDRKAAHHDWAELGGFMLSLALQAYERGLGTCFQESWATVRESLGRHFGLPENEMIYCGMALGYADPQAPINSLRSERATPEEFAQWRGFADQ